MSAAERGQARYDAFISYSHAADGRLAPALQTGLQRFARTWRRRRAMTVFRDETGLAVNPDLWGSIVAALDASHRFVLLASPGAAASRWVGEEIDRALETKGVDGLIVVVTDGAAVWDAEAGDFTAESDAVHPVLRGRLDREPRIVDMTWARSEDDLTLDNPRFRTEVARVVADITGERVDEAIGRDQAARRTTARVVGAAISVLAVAAAAAVAAAGVAVSAMSAASAERDTAEEQAAIARAYEYAAIARAEAAAVGEQLVLAGFARTHGADAAAEQFAVTADDVAAALDLDDDDIRPALALAAEAHALHASDQSVGALLTALAAAVQLGVTSAPDSPPPPPDAPAASADGAVIAVLERDGTGMRLIVADEATGSQAGVDLPALREDCDGCSEVAVAPDGGTIVVRLSQPDWSATSAGGQAISFHYADGVLTEQARRGVSAPGIVRFSDDGASVWLRDDAVMRIVSPSDLDDLGGAIPVVRTGPIRFGGDRFGVAPSMACAPPALISGDGFATLGELPVTPPQFTEGGCVYDDVDIRWISADALFLDDTVWPVDGQRLAEWACEVAGGAPDEAEIASWTGAAHEPVSCGGGA